jgi:hypothetical protein
MHKNCRKSVKDKGKSALRLQDLRDVIPQNQQKGGRFVTALLYFFSE